MDSLGGSAEGYKTVTAEENMALARRFCEARVKGDLDTVDEMMAPDFVSHTKLLPGQEPGREGEKRAIAEYSAAVSNASVLVEDQVAAGDKVVTRLTVRATHDRRELMGLAPTGREMTNMAVFIHRIAGGKIVEQWSMGSLGSKLRRRRLEQERIERERVEQELRVARRIQEASLPKAVPELEGWEISYLYRPAREVGGILRLPSPLRGPPGALGGGRHRQGGARSACDVHNLRHVAARRSCLGLLFARGGT